MNFINKKTENNTGLSTDGTNNAGRYYINNGTPNILKTGIPFFKKLNLYHYLIHVNSLHFLILIFLSFIVLNMLFAFGYFIVGFQQLSGLSGAEHITKFSDVFFFSCQTFTTVGYGGIHPISFWSSALSSLESLVGLLYFALITGLIYGRFSKPRAFIEFTKNIIIAPYNNGIALMVRCATFSNHVLSNVTANITLAIKEKQPGSNKIINRFYNLNLEIDKISAFILSWTLVHVIDEKSPLFGLNINDLNENQFELLVFLNGFDESFSNMVIRRHSFATEDLIWGAKFKPMILPSNNSNKTILDFNNLNTYELAALPTNNM